MKVLARNHIIVEAMPKVADGDNFNYFICCEKCAVSHYPHIHISVSSSGKYEKFKLPTLTAKECTFARVQIRLDGNYTLQNMVVEGAEEIEETEENGQVVEQIVDKKLKKSQIEKKQPKVTNKMKKEWIEYLKKPGGIYKIYDIDCSFKTLNDRCICQYMSQNNQFKPRNCDISAFCEAFKKITGFKKTPWDEFDPKRKS